MKRFIYRPVRELLLKLVPKLVLVIFLLVFLAACGGAPAVKEVVVDAPQVESPVVEAPELEAPEVEAPAVEVAPAGAAPGETLVDEQGAVAVTVTPRQLDTNSATLDFEVAMNTHSVDLSMDLAQLATLTTDTGAEIGASGWEAPQGGHHVSGVLSFPAESDGNSLLAGASSVTLTLENLDAPLRTFTWALQ